VRELIDPATRSGVLIFDGGGMARLVRVFPADWRGLSDDELYTLSWSR
jgi:hypothetical protein